MALDFIAGCIGGCAGIIVGHPLDTIKVRIQTQNHDNPLYKGTYDCFQKIVKQESFLGLFKGVTSPLGGIAVINAIVFGVYGNLQRNLPNSESITSHFTAGVVAGVIQSFICSPMELAKTRIQLQKTKIYKNPFQCLNFIRKKEGIRGVMRGLTITIVREGIGFGAYFATYEWMTRSRQSENISISLLLLAGGCSGAASWLSSYPLDVIKSRIQADGMSGERLYKNSFDCFMKSIKSEGFGCLFKGLSPTLLRAFPVNSTTWSVVTLVMNLAQNHTYISEDSKKCISNTSNDFNLYFNYFASDGS